LETKNLHAAWCSQYKETDQKKEKRKLISGSKTKERKRFQYILKHENLQYFQ